ncbi:MAG: hypothetical protein ACTHKP_02235 [Nitrososphaeraceae archaeon]
MKDTANEIMFDFQVNLKELNEALKSLKATHSDLLRLTVNEADSEMSITPITKSR